MISLLQEKLSSPDTTAEWVVNFYENTYLKFDWEKMVAEFGTDLVKQIGLDWILKNSEEKQKKNLSKIRKKMPIIKFT